MLEGARFVLQQPLALLVLVAAGLLLHWSSPRQWPAWLLAFAVLAAITMLLPAAAWQGVAAAGYLAVAGAWQAWARALHGLAARGAVAAAGLALAWAAALAVATPAEAAGGIGLGVVMVAATAGVARLLRRVLPRERHGALACRIAGSWLAAVGLLLVALALARGR